MNLRENVLAALSLRKPQRTPRWELGYWAGTLQRWYREGLNGCEQDLWNAQPWGAWVSANGIGVGLNAEPYREHDVASYFAMDRGLAAVDLNYNACPCFEPELLDETDTYTIRRTADGIVTKTLKPEQGMPQFLDFPVHNRSEWEHLTAERYQADLLPRLPANWENLKRAYGQRDYPLALGAGATGYFGSVRQMLGLERTLTTFLDDPAWMHAMLDHLADFYVKLYDQVLSQISVDLCVHWEDMCYVDGPLISPRLFRDFMLQPYRRLADMLRDHGVTVLMVDTDGDARRLLPLFQEGGVNAMYPFDVQSGMDVRVLRREYPGLALQGGIDKKVLTQGHQAIDAELESKVPVVLAGGYIPHIDHAVPPDVSFADFSYYRRRLDALLDTYDAANMA
ncbi:MAG: uroporphyrinogen decarboxylase family protein [Anaerolineae bacterium]